MAAIQSARIELSNGQTIELKQNKTGVTARNPVAGTKRIHARTTIPQVARSYRLTFLAQQITVLEATFT